MKKSKQKKRVKATVKVEKPERLAGHWGWRDRACYGRAQALYVFRRTIKDRRPRFLKVGEYCARCGKSIVFDKFQAGISAELEQQLEPGGKDGKKQ